MSLGYEQQYVAPKPCLTKQAPLWAVKTPLAPRPYSDVMLTITSNCGSSQALLP